MTLNADQIIATAYKLQNSIRPEERSYAEIRMNKMTSYVLDRAREYKNFTPTLLGINVIIDDTVEPGELELFIETPQERRMKEFAAEMTRNGKPVVLNSYKTPYVTAVVPDPPTLRALVKWWLRRLR